MAIRIEMAITSIDDLLRLLGASAGTNGTVQPSPMQQMAQAGPQQPQTRAIDQTAQQLQQNLANAASQGQGGQGRGGGVLEGLTDAMANVGTHETAGQSTKSNFPATLSKAASCKARCIRKSIRETRLRAWIHDPITQCTLEPLSTGPNATAANTGTFSLLNITPPVALATLPACSSTYDGAVARQTNSTAACSSGTTATSAGTTHCELICDGANWV